MNKTLRIFEWIITVLAIITLIFGIIWFGATIYYTNQESNLGNGLSIALSIIFNLYADGISLLLSVIGYILCYIDRKKQKSEQNKFLMISNIVSGLLSIILFIMILIVV
ncbi:MAG: hypothetical protein IJX78_07440 [Bacilli bacterium]|nr:hypothetical protein [Bacilli bacterium]